MMTGNMPHMRRVKNIHFVGIGGIGMGGIAQVLFNQGYQVSGSDLSENDMTEQLQYAGIKVYHGHHADYVQDADVVVFSTAINQAENPEIIAAREAQIPVIPRAQMLAELMRFRHGIAVTGTHGKTTTTSFIASILGEADLDPTFVIGGKLNSLSTSAQLGKSAYFVAEADESDASFLYLQPMMTVVTNIDADHLEAYNGEINRLHDTFLEFIHHLPFYGLVALCIDDPVIEALLPEISRPRVTYGFSEKADVRLLNYRQVGLESHFTVKRGGDQPPLDIKLNMPGRHNALNAVAAMVIAMACDVPDQAIIDGLAKFGGVGRRFQVHEGLNLGEAKGVTLIDDYGHHPEEISVTLKTIRDIWPDRRVVLLFQPHRFSRTQRLFQAFVLALARADKLLLLDIYPASELPIEGVTSQALCDAVARSSQNVPVLVDQLEQSPAALAAVLQDNDVLVIQGAGSVGRLSGMLLSSC